MHKYKRCLLTYLDILGFKQIVETKTADEIWSILDSFKEAVQPGEYEKKSRTTYFINFSDTNIRAINLNSKYNLQSPNGLLFWETLHVAHVQARLIDESILIRGSLTIDNLYFNKGMIFGPALNRGYYLETDIAVYPRVAIDPEVLRCYESTNLLKSYHHDLDADKEHVLRNIRKDNDGIYYIDYLRTMESEFEVGGYGSFLNSHKNVIENKAQQLPLLNSLAVKYSWLIEYHNSTILSLGPMIDGWNAADLLIDPSVFQFIYNL